MHVHDKIRVVSASGFAASFVLPSLVQPAAAADLGTIVEPPPPPTQQEFAERFSGVYFGAGVTYSQLTGDLENYATDIGDDKDVFGSAGISDSAFGFNVEVGYDVQHDNGFVFGVAADATIAFSALEGGGDEKDFGDDIETEFFHKITNTGSLLGRIGFTPNNKILLYGLAGVTFAQYESGGYINSYSNGSAGSWSDSGITHGYTLGAGLEAALHHNMSVKFEYRFTDLQDVTASGFADGGGLQGTNWFEDGHMHQGMVKLIYRVPPN